MCGLHNETKLVDIHPSHISHDVVGACVGVGTIFVLYRPLARNHLVTFRWMLDGQLPDMHVVDMRLREGPGERLVDCLHLLIDPHHFYHISILRLVIWQCVQVKCVQLSYEGGVLSRNGQQPVEHHRGVIDQRYHIETIRKSA